MQFHNIDDYVKDHNVLSCPCKASPKQFLEHIPMKDQSVKAALMLDQIDDSALSEQIIRGHFKILAQKFDPDRNDPSKKEKCTTIMRLLNTCYINIQATLVSVQSDASGKARMIIVDDKVYTLLDEFSISCQHKTSFSIYTHPDHIQLWKEAIDNTSEFPPSHKLANGSGIQFGKKQDSIFISLFNTGSILIQGLMATLYGMEKLNSVQAGVSAKTRGTTPSPLKRSDHFVKALEHFPESRSSCRPIENPISQSNTDSSFDSRDDQLLLDAVESDDGCKLCLTSLTMLKDALAGLKVAAEQIQRLEKTVQILKNEQRELHVTTVPQLASRLDAFEARQNGNSPWNMPKPTTATSSKNPPYTIESASTMRQDSPGSKSLQTQTARRTTTNPVPQKTTWAPERCICVYEYDDKTTSRSLAGVRTEISSKFPNVKIETVHRPRNGNLLVQLDSDESARKVLESWDNTTFGLSKARALTKRKPTMRRFVTGVPQETTEESIHAALKAKIIGQDITITVSRILRDEQPTGTLCILFQGVPDETVLDEVWVTSGYLSFKLERPHTKRRQVIQCDRCQMFGHTINTCSRHTDTCARCGKSHHESACTAQTPLCVNCNRTHHAQTSSCPARVRIVELLASRQDV